MSDSRFSSQIAEAKLLIDEKRWDKALDVLLQAEASARRDFGPDDKGLAAVLELKANACKELGRLLEAERAMHESTRIRLVHLRSRGRSLAHQQKHADAEKDFREALQICSRAYGTDHVETATCLDNLASCLRCQSRFIEAIEFCQRACDIRIARHGEEHGHTAASFSNLGHLHRILGQFVQAQTLLAKSLIIREKVYGSEHPYVAESLDRIASLCRNQGRFEEAIEFGERCVRIRKDKLGPDHPLTAAAIHNLALSREQRKDDGTSPIGVGPETHPPTMLASASDSPRRARAVGLWVAGAIAVVVLAALGSAFIYFPQSVGYLIVAAVVMLSILGAVSIMDMGGLFSVELLIKKLMLRARHSRQDAGRTDRDALVLGPKSGHGATEIAGRNRAGFLNVDHARELVKLEKDPLDLSFVHSLTLAAADEIAKQKGTLKLNGLGEVPSKLAKSLRWHEGRLELNGVPELTEAAAAHISRHAGDLALCGMRELREPIAQHLAHHRGVLELNGVRSLNEQAAKWIIKHRGIVQLHECRLVSPATQRILHTNPHIEFPDHGSNGMM